MYVCMYECMFVCYVVHVVVMYMYTFCVHDDVHLPIVCGTSRVVKLESCITTFVNNSEIHVCMYMCM